MKPWEEPVLRQRVDVIIPYRMVVAPYVRDAQYFIRQSGFHPRDCKIVTEIRHLLGYDFRARPGRPRNAGWEIWFLGGHWPLATRKDIDRLNEMYSYLRYVLGADIRHFYT